MCMCSRRLMEQCESKATKLKEELVNTKEALNKATLQHEVLSYEKTELGTAVTCYVSHCTATVVSLFEHDDDVDDDNDDDARVLLTCARKLAVSLPHITTVITHTRAFPACHGISVTVIIIIIIIIILCPPTQSRGREN